MFDFFKKRHQASESGDIKEFYSDRVSDKNLRQQIRDISKGKDDEFVTEICKIDTGSEALIATCDQHTDLWRLSKRIETTLQKSVDYLPYGSGLYFFDALRACSEFGQGKTPISPKEQGWGNMVNWRTAAKNAGQVVDRYDIVQPTSDQRLLVDHVVSLSPDQEKLLHQSREIKKSLIENLSSQFKNIIEREPTAPYQPPSVPREVKYPERNSEVALILHRARIEKEKGYNSPEARILRAEMEYGHNSLQAEITRTEVQYGVSSAQVKALKERFKKAEEMKENEIRQNQQLQKQKQKIEQHSKNVREIFNDPIIQSAGSQLAVILAKARIEHNYGKNSEEMDIFNEIKSQTKDAPTLLDRLAAKLLPDL